ncbi:MAG: hypothetical protein QE263_04935 [Vampirovibrionales bacterium]|nr:hypothetical protein [Vampirovibrionales bacterium]
MTYAQERLKLGITTVGFWVVIATLLLVFNVPEKIPSTLSISQLLAGIIGSYILLSFPFDVWGGYVLPKKFNRSSKGFFYWLKKWAKGCFSQGVILLTSGYALFAWFHIFDSSALRLAFIVAIQLIFALFQKPIAFWTGSFSLNSSSNHPNKSVWNSQDIGFTGGATLIGQLIYPAHWLTQFPHNESLLWITKRRDDLIKSLSNGMGYFVAVGFNTLGAAIVLVLGSLTFAAPSDWLTFILGTTLWSFLGVLVLPMLNQKAVLHLDLCTISSQPPASMDAIKSGIVTLDAWQDEEPSRHPWVQRIFHPIPSVTQRLGAFQQPNSKLHQTKTYYPWHVARRALFLSWPLMGLLNRAVHCNVGRPDLWVFLPSEG